jgi:hypothetical protein
LFPHKVLGIFYTPLLYRLVVRLNWDWVLEMSVSLTVFLAFCIVGCNFMVVMLFEWIYSEKRRERPSNSTSGRHAKPCQTPVGPQTKAVSGPRLITKSGAPISSANERIVYERITAAFASRRT